MQTFFPCSSVFEPCHKHVSLSPYLEACTADNCNGGNYTCTSLEAYATQCAEAGICIDWRNATGGQCGKIMFISYIYMHVCVFIAYFYIYLHLFKIFSMYITEHKCPSDKVYMACGSTVEPTCNER